MAVLLVCCLHIPGRPGTRVVAGTPAGVRDDGLPMPVQSPLKTYSNATAEDLDGDGMPNDWEDANGLDKNNAADAVSDFDGDGLTALQEYRHGTSPLGEWSRRIIDTSGLPGWVQYIYPVGISDSGSVLFAGDGIDPDTGNWRSGTWLGTRDGGLQEITHPDATYVYAYDLNADDEVVGYGYDASSNVLPFFWSPQTGWQDFDTPPGVTGPVYPERINAWGDVLLRDGDQNNVLIDPLGNVIDIIGDNWTSPQITDINDFREAIGTYTHPVDGLSYTFLKLGGFFFSTDLPSSYPDLADYENYSSWAGMLNNYGEFAGSYNAWGPDGSEDGAYFYDGQYHIFENDSTSYTYMIGLNDVPQVLIYDYKYENDTHIEQHLLRHGNIQVAMESLVPPGADWEYTYYYGINNHSEVVGYAELANGLGTTLFVDYLNQDRDGDGMSDDWESYYGLNADDASDANTDADGDGITNLGEFRLLRDPTQEDPVSDETGEVADLRPGIDTDGDGMPNTWEVHYGLDWENPADASQDPDRDGYSNLQEFHLGTTPVGSPSYRIRVIGEGYATSVYSTTLNDNGRVTANGIGLDGNTVSFLYDFSSGTPVFSVLTHPEGLGTRVYCQAEDVNTFGGQLQDAATSQYFPGTWSGNQAASSHQLAGMTHGQIQSLSPGGNHAMGKGYKDNAWVPLIVDGAGQVHQLPDDGSTQLGYGKLSVHEDGHAAGELYFSGYGYDAVIWHKDPAASTWTAQRLPAKSSPGIQLSKRGELIAAWRGNNNNTQYPVRVWTAADGMVELGTLGGRYSSIYGINGTGAFVGYSQAIDPVTGNDMNKAFIGRRDVDGNWGLVPLATEPGHTSYAIALNDHGEVAGTYYDGSTSSAVLWVGTGNRHDLNTCANASIDGFSIDNVSAINNRGEILASATKDGIYYQVLLQPDADTDDDGIPDRIENQYALNPFDPSDASLDPDGDELTHLEEFRNKTNPFVADTDADGMPDGWEVLWGLDALDPYNATGDHDRDHVTNLQEYQAGTAPTGIYRMEILDAAPVTDLQSAYVRSITPGGDVLIQGYTQTGQTLGILAVKENGAFTYHTMPVLAEGKNVYPRKVTDSGRVFGTAQDASDVYHLVSWAPGEASLTQHPFPRDTSYAFMPINDVSTNGEYILAYWKTPEGVTGQGVIRLDGTGNASVEQSGISISESLPNGYYYRWFNSVTDDGLLIGMDEVENYDDYTMVSTVVLLDPVTGETSIGLPESPYADEPYGSYAYTWLTGDLLPDGTQLISRETYTDTSHLETLLLDTNELTVTSLPYPLKGYAYPVGIAQNGTVAAQDENMRGHIINGGHSLQLRALRILGSESSFSVDPATLPRADELLPGDLLTPEHISGTGSIGGQTNTGTPDESKSIWIITEVLDEDGDGMSDDWERYRAQQLLQTVDLSTLTTEQQQQLKSGNLDADTDYDGDGNTAGDDYEADAAGANKDSDGDGLSDAEEIKLGTNPYNDDTDDDKVYDGEDAVPTDGEINWKRTPEVQYVLIPQVEKTGATAVSRHGHILFPFDYWNDFQYENTESSEILWNSATSDWVNLPGSSNWVGSGLELNGEAIVVNAGWDAVSGMNDNGILVGHSYFSGADDGGPSEIPVYMTWKLDEGSINGYQQPLYAVPSANYAEESGLLDYGIAVYADSTGRDLSAIISDDGAIGGQAYSLLPSTNEFMSCFVSNGNLNGHTNTMTKWGDFNNADPLAILDQTTGLVMEKRDNANDIVHYRSPAGVESLANLFPNTVSSFWNADISRTPATVGAPAVDGNPAIPARPDGRVWFSINSNEGNKVFLEKRLPATGTDLWHEPESMDKGAIKLNARGEAITETHLWRNGKYESIKEIINNNSDSEHSSVKAIDLSSNGLILVQSKFEGVDRSGILLPVEVVSRDRMLAGSIEIPEGWEDSLEIEFVHKETGENLGKYGHLLSKENGAYLYDSWWEIHGDAEAEAYDLGLLDSRILDEQVVFCKREGEDRVIEFYTAFGQLGDVEIRFHLNGGNGVQNGTSGQIVHQLYHDSSFGGLIDYINMVVTESPFEGNQLAWEDGASSLVGAIAPPDFIDPQAMRTIVALLNGLPLGIEDAESVIYGLVDGILQGLIDDWELLKLLGTAGIEGAQLALQIGDQVQEHLVQEILRWKNDPKKRALELSGVLQNFVRHAIMEPIEQLHRKLEGAALEMATYFTSFDNMRDFGWDLLKRAEKARKAAIQGVQDLAVAAAVESWKIHKDIHGAIYGAVGDWLGDFAERMYEGAEQSLFIDEPWGSVDPWRKDIRTAFYTFGYVFGYLVEQTLLGKGIAAMGKGMAKLGVRIVLAVVPHVKRMGARVLPFVAKAFSRLKLGGKSKSETIGMVKSNGKAMQNPTGKSVGNHPTTETVSQWMDLQDAAKFSGKHLVDEVMKLPRIRTLIKNPAFRHMFKDRIAKMSAILGDDLTADAMKGFIRAYDRLIKTPNGLQFSDRFDDFLVLFKAEQSQAGKTVLKESLENFKAVTDMNPNAAQPLLYFKRIDEVQDEIYRYQGWDPRYLEDGSPNLSNTLDPEKFPKEAIYVSMEKMPNPNTAISKAQLPPANTAKFRVTIESVEAKNKTSLAYGDYLESPILEPRARDFPFNGDGGATQLIIKGEPIKYFKVEEWIDGAWVERILSVN